MYCVVFIYLACSHITQTSIYNVICSVAGYPRCVSVHQDIQLEQWHNVFQHDDWQFDTWQQAAL